MIATDIILVSVVKVCVNCTAYDSRKSYFMITEYPKE